MATPPLRALVALACAAEFVVVLDVSIVNVALPSIDAALSLGTTGLPWIVNAYALTFGGLLLLGGRLADVLGTSRVFVAGLALFTGASLLGGLATSGATLVAARALQGVGAAVLAPATLTLLTATVPDGPRRTRALAAWTAVGVVGGAAGNVLGGALTDLLSWRAIFLVAVPAGLGGLVAARRLLPRAAATAGPRPRLDVLGAVLATAGLSALTFGLGHAGDGRLLALAAGALLLAAFAGAQRRAADPLLPPALLRLRHVAVGNLVTVVAAAALVPMWFVLSLQFQRTLGYGPLTTGLAFLPHTLGTAFVALRLTPVLMRHADGRVLVGAGALVLAAGFAWQSQLTPSSGYLGGVLGPAVLLALGGGVLTTPLTRAVTTGVHPDQRGAASGVLNVAKQVGGAVGLAALVAATGTDSAAACAALASLCVATAVLAGGLPRTRDA